MGARQNVLNEMINRTRSEVIKMDIEYNYLIRVKQKGLDKPVFDNIDHHIEQAKAHYDLYLEKLIYLKELRDNARCEKIQEIVEKSSAEIVSASIV